MKQKTEGRGVLFHSAKKTDKSPDFKGELVLDANYGKGTVLRIAGWRKQTPKNYLISLSISQYQNPGDQWPKQTIKDGDVEIPF